MLNPAPLIHPIISGDVRGGDLHGERPVQERGPGSLQQKPRFRQSFPGGIFGSSMCDNHQLSPITIILQIDFYGCL